MQVISFAQSRGWDIKDGRIYFPNQRLRLGLMKKETKKVLSQMAIENTLGYARELETYCLDLTSLLCMALA